MGVFVGGRRLRLLDSELDLVLEVLNLGGSLNILGFFKIFVDQCFCAFNVPFDEVGLGRGSPPPTIFLLVAPQGQPQLQKLKPLRIKDRQVAAEKLDFVAIFDQTAKRPFTT